MSTIEKLDGKKKWCRIEKLLVPIHFDTSPNVYVCPLALELKFKMFEKIFFTLCTASEMFVP